MWMGFCRSATNILPSEPDIQYAFALITSPQLALTPFAYIRHPEDIDIAG